MEKISISAGVDEALVTFSIKHGLLMGSQT